MNHALTNLHTHDNLHTV